MKQIIPILLSLALVSTCLAQRIQSGNLAVKIKPTHSQRTNGFPIALPSLRSAERLLKSHQNARRETSVLSNVFILEIEGNEQSALELLRLNPQVEYAVSIPEEKLLHIPNDPEADPTTGGQTYLEIIRAYEAWDITKGNENIVIGIIDTGMATDHEDLVDNYYFNPNEVDNGIDDDENGYIDDLLGYDFADNDNDPHADTDITSTLNHGTHVGGIAGATTNNGIGVAGIGYNSKVVPLKGFTTVGLNSIGLWEAVLYAADNGYDVANLSWGNTDGYNQFFQDIINYCVLEKDMVVIAAAGNTNADLDFYPASYEHVLSVGASTLSDTKWSSATFGDHLDIMAPGVGILSTQKNNTYNSDNGSSHATPMVAGASALVKAVFPDFNARQVMEQLRATTDDIYSLNPSYPFKLGKGRLNVFRAVTETSAKSLRVEAFSYTNGFGPFAFHGDTLTLTFNLTNYLAPITEGSITLESDSPYVTIIDPSKSLGAFDPMQNKTNYEYQIILDDSTPESTEIDLRFVMNDGAYSDFQNISFVTEPNHFTFGNDQFDLSVFGDGSLVYADQDYTFGSPATFNNLPVLQYSGLMIGTSGDDLSDNVTNTFSLPESREDDFAGAVKMRLEKRDSVDMVGTSAFNSLDGKYRIEQSIIQGITDTFVLLRYRIVNTSGGILNGIHSGFFADFLLGNPMDNHGTWDDELNALIMYDDENSTFASLGVMTENFTWVALDMQAHNGNMRDVDDDFTDTEKFGFLSGANIDAAGEFGSGNDVALMVGQFIGDLQAGEGKEFTVVLAMANNYNELSLSLAEAQKLYQKFNLSPKTKEVILSCSGSNLNLDPTDGVLFNFYRNPTGTDLIASGENLLLPALVTDTVIFVRNIDPPFESDLQQIKIYPKEDIARFSSSRDTLYLDSQVAIVELTDQSVQPLDWQWDFGNGSQSTLQHPTASYDSPGNYTIALTVNSALGCEKSFSREIIVAERPPGPVLSAQEFCKNESLVLVHPTDEYSVYDHSGNRLLKAQSLTLGPFEGDTVLLIAQWQNGFESLPAEVPIFIDPIRAKFQIYPDTLSSEISALFRFSGENADTFEWRVDGNIESNSDSFTYPISGPIALSLEVGNAECSDQVTTSLSFVPSPVPVVPFQQVCSANDILIKPDNGTYFAFYEDEEMESLIHKGTQLYLTNVTSDRTIWVSGLDDILPSSPIEMLITVSDFDPEIVADPPALNLAMGRKVSFSSSESLASAEWYIDDVLVETALEPILFFNEIGTYQVTLIATDQTGCQQIETIDYTVFIPVLGNQGKSNPIIYPNPSNGTVYIESVEKILSIRIMNLAGQVLDKLESNNGINQLKIPKGIYLIELITDQKTTTQRISVQ